MGGLLQGFDTAPKKDVTVTTYYVLRVVSSSKCTVAGQMPSGHFTYTGSPKRFATVTEALKALARRSAVVVWAVSDPFEIVRVTETVTQGAPEVSADLTAIPNALYVVKGPRGFLSLSHGWVAVEQASRFVSDVVAVAECRYTDGATIRRVVPGKVTTKVTEEVLK